MDKIVEALIAAALLVIPALTAWTVSWLRAHTAASAVRQATQQYGDSPEADQAAADELHRMPWPMRPADVPKAIGKANEQQRIEIVRPKLNPVDLDGDPE